MNIRLVLVMALTALSSSSVLAHTGVGEVSGFSSGFFHPLIGLDHILAMTAVGMWAGLLGGRVVISLPLAFLGAMLAGVTLARAGIEIPAVEIGIATSVLVLGTAIALGLRLPAILATIVCAVFGVTHGYAHGIEIGQEVSALPFVAGFLVATALLHAGGLMTADYFTRNKMALNRLLGGGIAVAGAALLLG